MDPEAALKRVVTQATNSSDLELRRIIAALQGEVPTRKSMEAARHARLDEVMRMIEVETEGGGQWQWPLCQPNLLFSIMVSESKPLQTLLKAAFLSSPCSRERPWSLVVGFDEFVPGNKLQLQPTRKAMNLVFTFLELGSDSFGRRDKHRPKLFNSGVHMGHPKSFCRSQFLSPNKCPWRICSQQQRVLVHASGHSHCPLEEGSCTLSLATIGQYTI